MNNKSMLVVDDLEINRTLLKISFEKEYEVYEAADGNEALEILKSIKVDIVITDIYMEGMDGYDLIKAIKSDRTLATIPVIAVTEHNEDIQQKVLDLGADDFITKPFISNILIHRIKNVVAGNSVIAKIEHYKYCFGRNPIAFAMIKLIQDEHGQYTNYSYEYINDSFINLFSVRESEIRQKIYAIDEERTGFLIEVNSDNKEHNIVLHDHVIHKYLDINAFKEEQDYICCTFSDITVQRKIDREENKKLSAIINSIPTGICVARFFNGIMKPVTINPALKILLGGLDKELNREALKQLVHPEDKAEMDKVVQKLLKEDTTSQIICRAKGKDNQYIDIMVNCSSTREETGEVTVYFSVTDISVQKKLQKDLFESEKSLSTAVAHAHINYWEYFKDENKVVMNNDTAKYFDLPTVFNNYPDKWLSSGRVYKDDRNTYQSAINRLNNKAPYIEFQARIYNIEKQRYEWKSIKFSNVFDEQGNIIKAIATSQDIHFHKTLENRFMHTIKQNGIKVWEYDIKRHCAIVLDENGDTDQSDVIWDVPESIINQNNIHSESVDRYIKMYMLLNSGKRSVSDRIRVWNDEKQDYVWYEYIFTVVTDENGLHDRAICTSRDITAEMRSEQLYKEEQSYRYGIESSLLSTSRINLSKEYVEEITINGVKQDITAKKFSCDYAERMKAVFDKIFLPDEELSQMTAKGLFNLYKSGCTQYSKEFMAVLKNSEAYVWVHLECKMLARPDSGDIIAFVYNSDISEAYIQENTMNAVLENNYEMAGIILEGNKHVHMIKTSIQSEHMGKDIVNYDAAVRKYIDNFVKPEDKDDVFDKLKMDSIIKNLKTKPLYVVEFDNIEPNGIIRRKQMRFAYTDRELGIIATTRLDIDGFVKEEKRKQQELEYALNLAENANNAKSQFLATVSHEIRTPMNVILGMTELALNEPGNSDIVKEQLNNIDASGHHLLNLINDVLDMSKIESGEFELHPDVHTYEDFESAISSVILPLCNEKKINFVRTGKSTRHPVYVDRLRLNQVMFNLLSNAVKFTPEGGTIELKYDNVIKDTTMEAVFEIKDSGIGMSEEFQTQLFKPFTQESSRITTSIQGTGLGLSIAKGIIDKMGGNVTVTSVPQAGTTFRVTLSFPLADQFTNKPIVKTNEITFEGKRILVVDDHHLNRVIVNRLLANHGASYEEAENGKEAVEMYSASPIGFYDAILMDVRMPVMSGLEAAQLIRNMDREDAKSIPIIAMTANAYDSDREKSFKAGMDDHISKPIEPDILCNSLLKYMRKTEA